jgi:hypothetical protein
VVTQSLHEIQRGCSLQMRNKTTVFRLDGRR